MNRVLFRLRIVLIPLAFCLLLGATRSDYTKLITTGKAVIRSMESVQEKLGGIIRPLIDLMNDGVESVSKEYWEKKITPVLLQADTELSSLPDMLLSTLPPKFNIRSNSPNDEPWVSIYDLASSIKFIDLKRQNDIFDSEYIMLLIGASNYVQMYVSLLYGRYEMIERDKNRLQTIINDPEGFRREQIATKQREEAEAKAKREKEEQERKQNTLRNSPIVPNRTLDVYNSPFSFAEIPLGLEFHDCIARFKSNGFKVEKQETIKEFIYGFTPVAFIKGTYDGYDIKVRVQASPKSYRVYEMTVSYEMVLDEYEADELMNRIATNFAFSHPNYTVEPKDNSQTISLTQSLDGAGRLFNRMGIPSLGVILRDYSVRGDKNSYTGMISLDCVQELGKQGFFIEYRLYDHKIGTIAQNESK